MKDIYVKFNKPLNGKDIKGESRDAGTGQTHPASPESDHRQGPRRTGALTKNIAQRKCKPASEFQFHWFRRNASTMIMLLARQAGRMPAMKVVRMARISASIASPGTIKICPR